MQESDVKIARLLFPPDAIPHGVGEVVAETRRERGWSKAQLVRKARLHRASIYRLEEGRRPRADTLFRVAHALDIPIKDLVPAWPEWDPVRGHGIGEAVRERRRKLGMTLAELAGMIGVSEATLSRHERGIGASPRPVRRLGDDYVPCHERLEQVLGGGASAS